MIPATRSKSESVIAVPEIVLSFCSRLHYGCRVKSVCLTIRDCPADVHQALRERAAAHQRSLNSETIVVLKNALDAPRLNELELRRAILSIPSKARLSLAETRAAIREGRK
jgi:plasmid stability protein